MKKRIVSLLLVFCMVITLVPANVLADEVKGLAETTAGQTQTAGTTAAKPENPFADVKSGSWYEAAVLYARANGFFDGTSATTFEPEGPMTRAMFVTVLGRMAGVKAADYAGATDFTDVAEGTWYAPFVKWAARYGITTGTGNGKFSPDGRITREEMAVFFVRYFETFDAMPKADTTVTTKPADLNEVSSWAQDAVLKLWALGLLNGDGKSFAPKDKATRAQTAALCERTDRAVETWYSEPGVKGERVSVEPGSAQESGDKKPEEQKPSGGGSSGGGSTGGGSSSGGTTTTTYYEVSFKLGEGVALTGVALPETKPYVQGTRISELPTPTKAGAIFLGWYYNKELTQGAESGDTVTRDMTLYAKMAAGEEVQSIETPNYVTKTEVSAGEFTFKVKGADSFIQDGNERTLSFINITGGNVEVDYTVSGTTSKVYTVTATLEAGQTYKVELLDSAAEFVLDGEEQGSSVRILNILTEKQVTKNAALTAEVKENQISVDDTQGLSDQVFNGLYQIDENGAATQNAEKGTFTYKGEKPLQVGDVLAVTRGNVNLDDVTSTEGDVAYIKVTKVDGERISYEMADVEDVLFLPDVLPIESGWDTDGEENNASISVTEEHITAAMAGVDADSLDVGDFLAFLKDGAGYDTTDDGQISKYGRIETVTVDDAAGQYVITYTPATATDIENSLDVYYTQDREITLTEQEQAQIENEIAVQVRESGYAEEAAVYLAAVMLESDDLNTVPDADAVARRMEAMEPVITATGVSVQADGRSVSVEFDPTNIRASVSLNQSLKHLQGNGFGVSVNVPFEVTVGSIKIEVSAQFQEEVILRQSISTSRHKIGFLRYDYSLNASFVVGNYTGINFNATVVTEDDDGDESMTKKLEEIMDQMKGYTETPEMSATDGTMDSLAAIYQEVMENANDTWIDIVDIKLFENNGSAFLHIFCWQIKGSFVVSANLAVSIGMNFEYTTQKLYNFSVRVKSRTSTNETIDIITPNYTFDFYVVGTIGIRAGLRLEMYVGLFSLKLDKIGITADVGAYAQLWGYFFYHLEWKQGAEKKSNSAGALYIEIGVYLEIHFIAQAFSSSKLTWAPTLYDNQWPLWSAGAQQNVYEFKNTGETYDFKTVKTMALPGSTYEMRAMDLKTGKIGVINKDDAEERDFEITFSNSAFDYNPTNNTITVTPAENSVREETDMTIRMKKAALAFTSKPIQKTIHITWSDPENVRYISFNSWGGSAVEQITGGSGAAITWPEAPTKTGYVFDGWYRELSYTNKVEAMSTMPAFSDGSKGMTLYAKWAPATDTKYTVEHYQEQLNGKYELTDTEQLTGTTGADTNAQARSYTGFTAKTIDQKKIAPNGSTVVKLYYDRSKYTVTFAPGYEGAREIAQTYKYGAALAAPTVSREGYTFDGWYTAADGGERFETTTVTGDKIVGIEVTESRTVYARWTANTYTVSLMPNHGADTAETKQVTYDRLYGDALADAVREGYDFLGWYTAANGGTKVKSTDTVKNAENTTLYAHWKVRSYTVTFDPNEGTLTGSGTQNVIYGGIYGTLPAAARTGYEFMGWFTEKDGGTKIKAGDPVQITGDTTFYARWTASGSTQYTVRHLWQDVTGDGYTEHESETQYGTTAETTHAEAKDYTADGFITPAGVTQQTIAADGTTVIEIKYDRRTYTVTWMNGETKLGEITVRHGAMPQYTGDPPVKADDTKTWTFDGWEPAVAAAEADATYTAKFAEGEARTYKITYVLDGGTLAFGKSNPSSYTVGRGVFYFEDPTKEGYTFEGWYVGDTKYDRISETQTGDLKLTAKWTAVVYTITFDLNYEGAPDCDPASKKVTYGQPVGELPTPTRKGYTFAGWTLWAESTANDPIKSSDICTWTKLHTLYAHWTELKTVYNGIPDMPESHRLILGKEAITKDSTTYVHPDIEGVESVSYDAETGYTVVLDDWNGMNDGSTTLGSGTYFDRYDSGNDLPVYTYGAILLDAGTGDKANLTIILKGDNTVQCTKERVQWVNNTNGQNKVYRSDFSCGIAVRNANVTIRSDGGGSLTAKGNQYGIYVYGGRLTIENCTINAVNTNAGGGKGIYAGGISGSGIADITIQNATVTADGGENMADGYGIGYNYQPASITNSNVTAKGGCRAFAVGKVPALGSEMKYELGPNYDGSGAAEATEYNNNYVNKNPSKYFHAYVSGSTAEEIS